MKLYYVMDPMCSWCWGFRPMFQVLLGKLPPETHIQYVMGGLAPDSDKPMHQETRDYVQSQWRAVEKKTGANFNWGFWDKCQPRRSTYPACRAVIAAGLQGPIKIPQMIHAIQQAYYQQARNPSDMTTLLMLARKIDLDDSRFKEDINSPTVEQQLQNDFKTCRILGVTSFPSLRLQQDNQIQTINIDYAETDNMLMQISDAFSL